MKKLVNATVQALFALLGATALASLALRRLMAGDTCASGKARAVQETPRP